MRQEEQELAAILSNADRSMIEARAALTKAIGEMKCNQK